MNGNKLKELRESKYLSREEFADRIGVEVEEINNWEEYGNEPSKYDVERIASALNLDEDSLKWKLNVSRDIDCQTEETDIGLGGLLLGFVAMWGLDKLTSRKKQIREYEEEFEKEEDKNEETDDLNNSNISVKNQYGTITIETKRKDTSIIFIFGIFFVLFVIIGSILLSFDIKEKQAIEDGKISVGFYRDFKGENYEVVVEQLKVLGFNNIKLIDLDDSGIFGRNEGKIDSISIGGNSTFDSIDYFYPAETVIISYH